MYNRNKQGLIITYQQLTITIATKITIQLISYYSFTIKASMFHIHDISPYMKLTGHLGMPTEWFLQNRCRVLMAAKWSAKQLFICRHYMSLWERQKGTWGNTRHNQRKVKVRIGPREGGPVRVCKLCRCRFPVVTSLSLFPGMCPHLAIDRGSERLYGIIWN